MSHRLDDDLALVAEADPILDAARAAVVDFGVRRTTVIEVARRAGISRMTVYRRFPDADSLLRALMAREFGRTLGEAELASESAGDGRQRVVAEIRNGVDRLIDHPVMRRLLEVDPELLLPYFTHDPGRFQRLVVQRLAGRVEEGQADGSIGPGEPLRLATTLELALRGVVLNAARVSGLPDREDVLDELARMVDRYLRPE